MFKVPIPSSHVTLGTQWVIRQISAAMCAEAMLHAAHFLGAVPSKMSTISAPSTTTLAYPVVTDLTIHIFSPTDSLSTCELNPETWHRIEKELYLHTSQRSAWLYVALANEDDLTAEDLLVMDIAMGEAPPNPSSNRSWESRPGGIWVLRSKFSGKVDDVVTEVDVLFGIDAVDPRPQWTLMRSPLQLDAQPKVPGARLSLLRGRAKRRPNDSAALRVRENGKFRIVQISDTHMVTGVGVCSDAIDAHGKNLPESEADPLTMDLIGKILDIEKPDLVILAGDQLHHDISDSQSALFKVVAPMIVRSIPFAAVFGNHDCEGTHALTRELHSPNPCRPLCSPRHLCNLNKLSLGDDSYPCLLTRLQAQHRCQYFKNCLLASASQVHRRLTV